MSSSLLISFSEGTSVNKSSDTLLPLPPPPFQLGKIVNYLYLGDREGPRWLQKNAVESLAEKTWKIQRFSDFLLYCIFSSALEPDFDLSYL
jgi:hypothetical protein